MNKVVVFFVVLLGFLSGFSFFVERNLLSSEILMTLPQFAEEHGWQRTKNSLLADSVFQFEPWRNYAKERLLAGEFPFINDKNALGAPFFANQISAIFFPLNLVYYFLPVPASLFLIHGLKIYFLFLFSYLYFRVLGLAKPHSLFGAFLVICLGFPIVWLQWPQTNVFLFFPFLLYLTEKVRLKTRAEYLWNIGLSLSYFFVVLAGHPETALHVAIFHCLYVVFRIANPKKILDVYLFVFLGVAMASFSLFPFAEYLLNSHALLQRSAGESIYLPALAAYAQFTPFIFGGPHLEFYKPLWSKVNFQEIIGGYVGLSLLIFGLIAAIKIKKSSLVVYWIIVFLCSVMFSYGIFPFNFIDKLPLLSVSANHRLIGFAGLSLIILSVLYISQLASRGKAQLIRGGVLLVTGCIVISVAALFLLLPETDVIFTQKANIYFKFIKYHVLYLLLTTLLFFAALNFFLKTKSLKYLMLTAIVVCLQTLGLFYNYNTFSTQSEYYPKTSLTDALSKSPGTYLEVGNPALPENLNLMYGLSSIENYDAIEIAQFRQEYDKAFPEKNQWGNPDEVEIESLNKFGIKYIVSDYDLRFVRTEAQPIHNTVLKPLTTQNPMIVPLSQKSLSGIRFLPATFNRANDCKVFLEIGDLEDIPLYRIEIDCASLYNNMYYFVETPPLVFDQQKDYYLKISSDARDEKYAISFFGNKTSPYVLTFSKNPDTSGFELLQKDDSWYLFLNSAAHDVVSGGRIQNMRINEENISLDFYSNASDSIQLKKANYPGWEVYIDGIKSNLVDSPFLTAQIPKGAHFIEFAYSPKSFYLGLLVTFAVAGFITIYFLRNASYSFERSKYVVKLRKFQAMAVKIYWFEHAAILLLGIFVSLVAYVCTVFVFKPEFEMPYTTAINWFTVHRYPRQQDYFYYFTALPFTFFVTIVFWFIALWIKKRK